MTANTSSRSLEPCSSHLNFLASFLKIVMRIYCLLVGPISNPVPGLPSRDVMSYYNKSLWLIWWSTSHGISAVLMACRMSVVLRHLTPRASDIAFQYPGIVIESSLN
jgi:hypothetical protein